MFTIILWIVAKVAQLLDPSDGIVNDSDADL